MDTSRPTPDAELNAVLHELVTRAQAVLGERAWQAQPNPSLKSRLPADPRDVDETLAFIRYALALAHAE